MNGRSAMAAGSGLFIPAACTLVAQFMQHAFAAGYDAAKLPQLSWHNPLFLFAFLKAVALAVLVIHAARRLLARSGGAAGVRADRALGGMLGLNVALGVLLLLALRFINSEAFAVLLGIGVTKGMAKAALLCLVLALLMPLNKRLFRDISAAIGSAAGAGADGALANKLFERSLGWRCATYVLPLFLLHIAAVKAIARIEGALLPLAAFDALVVVAIGLAAGYAIFLAHGDARRFSLRSQLPR